jgi:ferredoxin
VIHDVTLVWNDADDQRETIAVSEDETVIDAAERVSCGLPFGCLTGACATCTGEVLSGTLEHRREPRALKPRHLEAGYVLLCIAEPRSDCRIRVGSDIQAELVSNPWKG